MGCSQISRGAVPWTEGTSVLDISKLTEILSKCFILFITKCLSAIRSVNKVSFHQRGHLAHEVFLLFSNHRNHHKNLEFYASICSICLILSMLLARTNHLELTHLVYFNFYQFVYFIFIPSLFPSTPSSFPFSFSFLH